jgi:hypothetical protein
MKTASSYLSHQAIQRVQRIVNIMSSPNQRGNAASALASIYDKVGSGPQLSTSDQNTIAVSLRLMQPAAIPLLDQLGISDKMDAPVHFLDNGCGSGVATAEAQARIPAAVLRESSFTCGDVAAGMVELVKKRIEGEGWVNTKAQTLDAVVSRMSQMPSWMMSTDGADAEP